MARIVSYLCTFIGLVFIISNIIMLRRGFVQLYATTFGDRNSLLEYDYRDPDSYDIHAAARWRQTGHGDHQRRALPAVNSPQIELPASVLAAELRLRKLMENQSNIRLFGRPSARSDYGNALSVQDEKYLRQQQVMAARPPYGVSFISVSSRDLRRFLHASSDCSGLDAVTNASVIGSGWTKLVYRARYRNKPAAVKTVHLSGHDLVNCVNKSHEKSISQCYEYVVLKLLREILLMRGFDSPHIVKVSSVWKI